MKVSAALCFSLVVLGVVSADDEWDKKKAKVMSFYKCIACAPADVQAAYEKCRDLKPEKLKKVVETCYKEVVGMVPNTSHEECWKKLCENPEDFEKIHDCIAKEKEELKKSITEEDMASFKKFKECSKGVNEQHCKE